MNQKLQGLIRNFNCPDSILVVSSYPEKGVKYSGKVCAVGGYAKNTLLSLSDYFKKRNENRRFVVLTVKIGKEKIYTEEGILVWRVFERNKPFSYLALFKALLKFNLIKDVLVEFEYASFGNSKTTSLLPLLTWFLKILRKKAVLVMHQVVDDLSPLTGHLGWEKDSIKISIYNKLLQIFLFTLCLPVANIVVLEEIFKKKLISIIGFRRKMHVIPHGIDSEPKLPPAKLSDEFVLLCFGYLTWYKGIDFLIQTIASHQEIGGKKIRLIVAGGESITQKNKPHYRKFVDGIYAFVTKSSNVTVTGFVPEGKIPEFFAAADLIILPYRVLMSSSGPLSLASTFNKPFILSSQLKGYFESPDFKTALNEVGLQKQDILFDLEARSLIRKIESVMEPGKLSSLSKFSSLLAKKRDFYTLSSAYARLLYDDPKVSLSPAFSP